MFAVAPDVGEVAVAFTRPDTALPLDPAEATAEGTPPQLTGTDEASIPVDMG